MLAALKAAARSTACNEKTQKLRSVILSEVVLFVLLHVLAVCSTDRLSELARPKCGFPQLFILLVSTLHFTYKIVFEHG